MTKFITRFWNINKTKIFIVFVFLVCVFSAFMFGVHEGKSNAKVDYANQKAKDSTNVLNNFIASTQQLIQSANEVSNHLAKQIVERKNEDEKSTEILRKFLISQSSDNNDCEFDDDVMRIIKQARNNATQQQPMVLPATIATPCEVPISMRSNSGVAAIEALKVLYDQYGVCASKLIEIINYINEVNSGQR